MSTVNLHDATPVNVKLDSPSVAISRNTLDYNEEQTQTESSSFPVNGAGVTFERNEE